MQATSSVKRLSSQQTYFVKYVFPWLWLGLLFVVFCGITYALVVSHSSSFYAFIPLIVLIVLGFGVSRLLVFDLADEVLEDEKGLLVTFKNHQEHIAFDNIRTIEFIPSRPPRVTIALKTPCLWGSKIVFSPAIRWSDLKYLGFKNSVAADLSKKINPTPL